MINPDVIFGRLGNRMFQGAFLLSSAKKLGIDHYFQDLKWIDDDTLDLYRVGIEPVDKVAVHVRRGDYVGHPWYVDLTQTDYYEKALKEFDEKDILVFSDDIAWCKEYFDGKYEYCEETDPVKALNIMAGCKGVIMSNSTFSWWAGYLSTGKVTAPKQWFRDGTTIKLKETWQKI